MFQMTVVRGWSSCVTTDYYSARWTDQAPSTIYIHGRNNDPDWVELKVGAYLECGENDHMPDPASLSIDFFSDSKFQCAIATYNFSQNEVVELAYSASSYIGGKYRYVLKLAYDHIRLDVGYEYNGKFVLKRATYCSLSPDRGSVFDADTLFNPNPLVHGVQYSSLRANVTIGSNSERWFSPAPFCFPLKQRDGKWMSVSPAPTVDELDFSGFSNKPCFGGECAFCLDYTSEPEYEGYLHLPEFVFRFDAESEFDALKRYADGLVELGRIEPLTRTKADWWRGVMVCGWFAQGGTKNCTQQLYESHVAKYDELGIDWDMLTIDDFWGKAHGIWQVDEEKWPDLKGFIARQHEKGRRVLLWVCVNPTGLEDDEVYIDAGHRLLDPLNPKYIKRVYDSFQYMLGSGEGSLDADGIKLDFTGAVPKPGEAKCTKRLYGMRYLYELYKLFHDAAKKAKPDCLLDYQVANPHFAKFHDMTRLNDYFLPIEIALPVMTVRAKVAHSVTFGAEVDTDHPGSVEYYENSYKLGNMSLYISNKKLEGNGENIDAIRRTIRDHIKPAKD